MTAAVDPMRPGPGRTRPAGGATPAVVVWAKGHGTRNDFVLLDDPDGHAFGDLDPALVRRLCDRRAGVGADGVLRVIRSAALAGARTGADQPEWFLDYRNADGTTAEMCGNGVRVFAQYLVATGRAAPGLPVPIGTRAGLRTARPVPRSADAPSSGWWSVDMGPVDLARYRLDRTPLTVAVDGVEISQSAVGADVGNPHAVVLVTDLSRAGSLAQPPRVTPPTVFPEGVNVEFVQRTGRSSFAMRVYERGAGETESCGTGICAAAAVLYADGDGWDARDRRDGWDGRDGRDGRVGDPTVTFDVSVPGGALTAAVTSLGPDRYGVTLAGPAVLVGTGELTG